MIENHTRVEAYLDQLLVPLARNLSDFHRDELRRELRAHLWGRVEAYRELGQTEEEAVTEALKQFGGAKDFTRQWRREWLKMPSTLTVREVWEAGRQALRPTLLGLAATMLPFVLLAEAIHSLNNSRFSGWLLDNHGAVLSGILGTFAFLVLPVLIGTKYGRAAPKNAGVGMLAALTVEMLVAGSAYQLFDWASPGGGIVSGLFVILLGTLVLWLPLASGAAAVSGWWRRRTKARLLV